MQHFDVDELRRLNVFVQEVSSLVKFDMFRCAASSITSENDSYRAQAALEIDRYGGHRYTQLTYKKSSAAENVLQDRTSSSSGTAKQSLESITSDVVEHCLQGLQ